jgi:hypothetical protein
MSLHVWFAALMLLVLATQAARMADDARTGEPPDLAAVLTGLDLRPAGGTPEGILLAESPGCAEPAAFSGLGFNGLNDPASRALRARGTVRTAYLGEVTEAPSKLHLLVRSAAASLRHAAGLRAAPVPQDVVQFTLPAGCPALARRDWTALSPW